LSVWPTAVDFVWSTHQVPCLGGHNGISWSLGRHQQGHKFEEAVWDKSTTQIH